jgi:hypothetical protein
VRTPWLPGTEDRYPKDHVPQPKDWTCQWAVKPHVRRYKNGKVITIGAYIKGPKGKPFRDPKHRAHVVKF